MSETGTVKTIHSCTLNGQTVTSEGCDTFEEYLKKIGDLAESFWADMLAKKEQQGETKPKWKSETCGYPAFMRREAIQGVYRHVLICAAPKGHTSQHWATVGGERVNWE